MDLVRPRGALYPITHDYIIWRSLFQEVGYYSDSRASGLRIDFRCLGDVYGFAGCGAMSWVSTVPRHGTVTRIPLMKPQALNPEA